MPTKLQTILVCIAIFLSLVFYAQQQTRMTIGGGEVSALAVSITGLMETQSSGVPQEITWEVISPSEFMSDSTAIYWSTTSSPSALTKYDAPDSQSFDGFSTDYISGNYFLPSKFKTSLVFGSNHKDVYVRAYAKVRGDHLWSEEKKIRITP